LFRVTLARGAFMGGWINLDGILSEIVTCKMVTKRDPITLFPQSIDMTTVDGNERTLEFHGDIQAATSIYPWPHAHTLPCQVRWTCNKLIGHGETLELLPHYFVRGMARRHDVK
jgi:hypothetical protein